MALVDPDCFMALSVQQQFQQLYEAAYTWAVNEGADVSSLQNPDCFEGLSNSDQAAQFYGALYQIAN